MNITRENIDAQNLILKVQVSKADYDQKVTEVLNDYRKKASIKGFRQGKVPFGMIKKMYGPSAQVEEINKIVSTSVSEFITNEKLEILGDPLPVADENLNFESQEDFEFSFEIGVAPEFEIKLSPKNKIPYYEIKIDEKLRNEFLENYTRRYGEYLSADIVEADDLLKADINQLDKEGNIIENGLYAANSTLSVSVIKDESIKSSFLGAKVGEIVDFDIDKAYPNDYEKAGIFQKKKEDAGDINGVFRVKINAINRFKKAELNQDLFDKIYTDGDVKSVEEFMKRVEEEIKSNLSKESDYKLGVDIKKLTVDKTSFTLPEEFLKKWLIKVNKEISLEDVEKDFPHFLEDLRWQLIRNKVASINELKIEDEELKEEARNYTRLQFQQYGLYNAPVEQIDQYALEILKREEDYKKIAEKILEDKVIGKIKEMVKVEPKKVSTEEFNKLFTN
jgi:trigger factor